MTRELIKHEADCNPGDTCVECDGCECGAIPSACTGPGCWTQDAHDQWCDEMGMSHEEGSYG